MLKTKNRSEEPFVFWFVKQNLPSVEESEEQVESVGNAAFYVAAALITLAFILSSSIL